MSTYPRIRPISVTITLVLASTPRRYYDRSTTVFYPVLSSTSMPNPEHCRCPVVVFHCSSLVLVFLYLLISRLALTPSIRTSPLPLVRYLFLLPLVSVIPCRQVSSVRVGIVVLCFTLTLLVLTVADGGRGVGVGYILGPLSDGRYTHSTYLTCPLLFFSRLLFRFADHKIEIRNFRWMCSFWSTGCVSLLYHLVPLDRAIPVTLLY